MRFIRDGELETNPVTSSKEVIVSRRGTRVNEKGELVEGSYIIDVEDATKLLTWLAEKAPLMSSTGSLNKAYKDMRTALIEIMEAVSE